MARAARIVAPKHAGAPGSDHACEQEPQSLKAEQGEASTMLS